MRILSSSGDARDALNEALNQRLPWPFKASTASVRDRDGRESDVFGTVIAAGQFEPPSKGGTVAVDADNTACVIDVNDSLGIESLRTAYDRVAAAKRLRKTAAMNLSGVVMTTVTLGVVFARNATLPIEQLAEELDRLNAAHPDREWTDMVVVLSKGIINYAVQFPGEGLSGDFLPPAEGALAQYSPPLYVVMVVKPPGRFSFNRMCSFILGHLAVFSPGAKLPHWSQILDGAPQDAIAITGYQYNFAGQLRPVPREFHSDRYLPPRAFLIEDAAGTVLSTVQFLPWQDGGVILLKGKLPLSPFLLFLGEDALQRVGVVKRSDGEMSYVLPIGEGDYRRMLDGIHKRSNMKVRADPSSFVLQKWMDEGTQTPVIARLYVGVFRLRDVVFPNHGARGAFDWPYGQVLEALSSARSASRRISRLLADHLGKVARGEVASAGGSTVHVGESIDDELRKETDSFVNSAARLLKGGMQAVTKELGKEIGFLFQKTPAFEAAIRVLGASDPELAAYLTQARKWSEPLMSCRNAIEHAGWTLPKLTYERAGGSIRAEEPKVGGQKVSEFASGALDRLLCFVEEVTVHCLVSRMPASIAVTEIPIPKREAEIPLRFQLTLREGGMPLWTLAYHVQPFDET